MLNRLCGVGFGKVQKLSFIFVLPFVLSLGMLNDTSASLQNDCYSQAILAFGTNQDLAVEVCAGADSIASAQCFLNAVNVKTISPGVAAALCKYALDTSPAECFRTATVINNLNEKNALNLCKPRRPCLQNYPCLQN